MMHKSTTTSWVRPPSTFTPAPELGRPPGGSSPVIHFFRDQETGARWIGKLGQVPLRDKEVIEAARRLPGFLGVYADEILEKLGLAVYQLLGTEVPKSALSYQHVTMEAMHPDMLLAMQLNAEDEGRIFELPHSPRMHYLSRYVEEFQPLDKDFVEHYLGNAKRCGNEYVKIQTRDGEMLPLRGLGSMLAAADFVYDLDCLGDACGNAGYVIREDRESGERYAQLVKIDAGYAFSYSDLRTDQRHNPRDRQIRVAPNQLRLQFADLAPADQKEFAATAKRILATPYEEFAHLFSQTQELKEGLSVHHCQQLLDELIARKSLFLKAFAQETDRSIVKEIEAAQAKIAKKLDHTEEVSSQAVEEMLAQEKEEAVALAELRVRLAVVDVKESESEKVGECRTFQLPSTNTHFVGREEALAEVVRQLNEARGSVIGQSISGIGGVGKTQLALHYAQAAASGEAVGGQYLGYDYVVWLNAELFLEGQFQAMAEVWIGEQLKADEAVEAVYRYLKGKRTLLVFDNAENARSIAAFLPPTHYASPVHFLITSRSAEWGGLPTVKLGGFSLEEAQEYVEYHLGPQSKEAVAKLVELLGGLPLAMSQAVSYIKAGHSTLEGFEEQFYLNQASLLSHELLEEEEHPKTVGTTLMLCLAQAKVKSALAEQLLGIVAYFAPENIKVELLQLALANEILLGAGINLTPETFSRQLLAHAIENAKEQLPKIIGVLESYSLISYEKGHVQVHRLVQEVMRHRHKFLKEPQSYWLKAVVALEGVVPNYKCDLEWMKQCSHAIVHVKQLGDLSKKVVLNREQELALASLLGTSGGHQQRMCNYDVARAFREQALEIEERYYGPDHVEVAETLVKLGKTYVALGEVDKAREILERALIIKERHYGSDCAEVARTLESLGEAYGNLGYVRREKESPEHPPIVDEQHSGVDNGEVVGTLANRGSAYGTVEKAGRKKNLMEWSVVTFEENSSEKPLEVSTALVNVDNISGAWEDEKKKKGLLERALVIKERHYGPDHVEVAETLLELSQMYGEWGKMHKAKKLLKRAHIIMHRHYGADHVKVAQVLRELGRVYGFLKNVRKAKELLKRSLIIWQLCYGTDHIEVAITLTMLGIAYRNLGKMHKAKDLLERDLSIRERFYGLDHVELAVTLVNLGNTYGELGDVGKQKELLERALILDEKRYGLSHVDVAVTASNLAIVCLDLNKASEAKSYAQKAYLIFKEFYTEIHPITQQAKVFVQHCEMQMNEKALTIDAGNANELDLPAAAYSVRKVESRRILFRHAVAKWVEEIDLYLKQEDTFQFSRVYAAGSVVSQALKILQKGEWEQFLEDPQSYGIYDEVACELNEFIGKHTILLAAKNFPDLVQQLRSSLRNGQQAEQAQEDRTNQVEDEQSSKKEGFENEYSSAGKAMSELRNREEGDARPEDAGERARLLSQSRPKATSSCMKCIVC